MSLLSKIKNVATPVAAPATVDDDNIIDIDLRDLFIRRVLEVRTDAVKQNAICYSMMKSDGMNMATLNAACKEICKHTDDVLIAKYGIE